MGSLVGPLTTTFTPPAQCSSSMGVTSLLPTGIIAQGPFNLQECYPSGYQPASIFYSPGVCPSGYTPACSRSNTIGTVNLGGRLAAFFSASVMRASRLSCERTRSAWPNGVP